VRVGHSPSNPAGHAYHTGSLSDRPCQVPLPIPRVEYTAAETATWGEVFRRCARLYPAYACRQYNDIFNSAEFAEAGYRDDNIPQLQV
jgi:phenylalanine-4-hydroxylase